MIFTELKCIGTDKTFDMKADENMKVSELVDELSCFMEIEKDAVSLVSVRKGRMLNLNDSLIDQGVLSGDRLILVHA